jgi:uncharacterized membrane protein YedE/YeeE
VGAGLFEPQRNRLVNDIGLALIGGGLIGLSATLLLATHGRVAGITGILGTFIRTPAADGGMRGWFLLGLVIAGIIGFAMAPERITETSVSTPVIAVAGLLVGFGTRLGNGCTSGHGVCGISRMSPRSLASVFTFILAGAIVVFFSRHVFGGAL